ncbi:2,4-dichlorophenol 6-monooxygenase [Fusarium longipes]|uniref:2,4-dichlorophenol 6-monooxygenase n=1 Tax=Fusarium longipes TaxID=694270 RepID=A0A395T7R5_9HYPO|nr:2,4-dichlorophenol 6-monooxygenase [Fusarium longipes]
MESLIKEETSVLIVGGGLSGLTTAVALGTFGVPTILLERRPEHMKHPRADGFNPTTVEIFRSLGFSKTSIPEKHFGFKLQRVRVHSLTGEWYEELAWNPQKQDETEASKPLEEGFSPYRGASMPQDLLEPILVQKAIDVGVDIRLSHEFVNLNQYEDNITCNVKVRNGPSYDIIAKYLVAADGHRSPVREALGVARSGHGHVSSVKSVLFRSPDLAPYLSRGPTQFTIDQSDLKAFMIAYQDGRLVLHLPNDREFTDSMLESLTRQAVGGSNVGIEFIESRQWDLAALIADRFTVGRVFLIGDAAHSLPPNRGGYGANTGVGDAYNLAWKLSQVVKCSSTPELLSTYEDERLPVAWLRHDQIFARSDFKTLQKDTKSSDSISVEALPDAAVEFGQIYRSRGFIGANVSLPSAQTPDTWAGQPGTRAPHVRIQHNDQSISTLQFFGKNWVLLSVSGSWQSAVTELAGRLPIDILFHQVQNGPLYNCSQFLESYGLSEDGCSLVRPDGYVAWRTINLPGNPLESLDGALRTVAFVAE